jgi:hypothetical protein
MGENVFYELEQKIQNEVETISANIYVNYRNKTKRNRDN